MAKKLNQMNVVLDISAKTDSAKRNLQDLQKTLNSLVSSTDLPFTKDIEKAVGAAGELSVHLKQATNVDTGKLDFTKLNQSLSKGKKSLEDYAEELLKLGPTGQQAFQMLATSIADSEIPLKRTHKKLEELKTTLMNSARWELSSKFLHGIEGAISSAYGYAQDLNKSLNNIRIVTGQNIDQMAKFAEEANRAAQGLSTTTLDYTNASLIYYQQGLTDQEVLDRTDITIKMANAAGESAEKVSEQLTSVWNNFYDGSKSLEHYANVMVKLGAETASSSDEIAEGVQKFASIGQTVGLSYEYAAAALATITDTTRESADVVGTALKTLFSRLEGLKLGETLDDGTDLNKYSKALASVGVEIKDTYGELKDADVILDETAEKWKNLSRDEKMALAQTVAGVRQYTQFMTLMENWDKMEQNIDRANNSEGALQEQAKIYAEGWEGARDRVKNALQGIYQQLLNDKFFVKLLNSIEKITIGIGKFIDNIGGLKTLLPAIGLIATQVFEKNISQGITKTAYDLRMMIPGEKEKFEKKQMDEIEALAGLGQNKEFKDPVDKVRAEGLREELILEKELLENSYKMSEEELAINKIKIERIKLLNKEREAQAKAVKNAIDQKDDAYMTLYGLAKDNGNLENFSKNMDLLNEDSLKVTEESLKSILNQNYTGSPELMSDIYQKLGVLKIEDGKIKDTSDMKEKRKFISEELLKNFANKQSISEEDIQSIMSIYKDSIFKNMVTQTGGFQEAVDDYRGSIEKVEEAKTELIRMNEEENEQVKEETKHIRESSQAQTDWSTRLTNGVEAVTATITVVSSLSNLFSTLKDDTVSTGDKVKTFFSTVLVVGPAAFKAASAAASAFNKALSTGPLIGIALALTALGVVIGAISSKIQENKKKIEEAANKGKEYLSTTSEEIKKNNELINSFEDLIASYRDGISSKEDLIKTGTELLNTYDIENGWLLLMTGRYEELAEAAKKAAAEQLTQQAVEAQIQSDNVKKGFEQDLKNNKTLDKAEVGLDYGKDFLINKGIITQDELDELQDGFAVDRYEAYKNIYDKLISEYSQEDLDIAGLGTFIDAMSGPDDILEEAYKEYQNSNKDFFAIQLNANIANNEGLINNLSKNLDSYQETIAELSEKYHLTEKEVKDVLQENPYTSDLFMKQEAALQQANLTGSTKYASDFINSQEKINTANQNISTYKEAQSKLKDNMSVDDLYDFTANSGIQWGQNEVISENEFITKPYEAQIQYLDQLIEEENNKVKLSYTEQLRLLQQQIQDQKDLINTNEPLTPELAEERSHAEDRIKVIKEEIEAIEKEKQAYEQRQELLSSEKQLNQNKIALETKSLKDLNQLKGQGAINDIAYGKGLAELAKKYNICQTALNKYNQTLNDSTSTQKEIEVAINDLKDAYQQAFTDETAENIASIQTEINKMTQAERDANSSDYQTKLNSIANEINNLFGTNIGAGWVEENKQLIDDFTAGVEGSATRLQVAALRDSTNLEELVRNSLEGVYSQADGILKIVDILNNTDINMIVNGQMDATQLFEQIYAITQDLEGTKALIEGLTGTKLSVKTDYELNNQDLNTLSLLGLAGDPMAMNAVKGLKSLVSIKSVQITKTGSAGYNAKDATSGRASTIEGAKGSTAAGSTKETKNNSQEFKNLKEESERYHVINNLIEDTTAALTKLSTEKDRAYGKDKIAAMDAEIAKQKTLIAQTKTYNKEVQEYYNKDKAALASGDKYSYMGSDGIMHEISGSAKEYLGMNLQFDENENVLLNYDALMEAAVNKYNAAVTAFDSKLTDDESAKVAFEMAEQQYNRFVALLNQYEETEDLFWESAQQLQDEQNKLQDFNYQRLEYWIDVKIDIQDDKLDLVNEKIKMLQNNMYKSVEVASLMWNAENNENQYAISRNKGDSLLSFGDQLAEAYANGDISQSDYVAGIDKVVDGLYTEIDTLLDLDESMRTYYSETLSKASERLSFYTDQMEHGTAVLQHYQKILELSGQQKSYDKMAVVLEGQEKTLKNAYEVSKTWYEELVKQRESIQAEMDQAIAAGDDDLVEYLQDKYQAIIETTNEAQDQMLSDLETWTEAYKAVIENQLAAAADKAENLITNGMGFDAFREQMDMAKQYQDEYYTKTNQLYEVNKMLNKIEIDSSKTTNKSQQTKLKNFSTMLEQLKEQDQLSKLELDIAQARYDVLVAEMALEDAKNAKTTVRLQRDSEGNYGYVYTADQDKINNAEQELADQQNNLYNIALEGTNKYREQDISLKEDTLNKLKELNEAWMNGDITSQEEYELKKQAVIEAYNKQHLANQEQLGIAVSLLNETAATDQTEAWSDAFKNTIDQTEIWKNSIVNTYTPLGDNLKSIIAKTYADMDAKGAAWKTAIEGYATAASGYMITYKNTINTEVAPTIGSDLASLQTQTKLVTDENDKLKTAIIGVKDKSGELNTTLGSKQTGLIGTLGNLLTEVDDVTKSYSGQKTEISNLIGQYTSYIEKLGETKAALAGLNEDSTTDADDQKKDNSKGESSSTNGESAYDKNSSSNGKIPHNDLVNLVLDIASKGKYGVGQERINKIEASYPGTSDLAQEIVNQAMAQDMYNYQHDRNSWKKTVEEIISGMGFKTGGYTGSWGPEGKLAVLHEKELVLNKEDTENILNSIVLLRDFVDTIDLQAASMSNLFTLAPSISIDKGQTLEQQVTITAEFPNVENRFEIEEAFNNLINKASQYANRKI